MADVLFALIVFGIVRMKEAGTSRASSRRRRHYGRDRLLASGDARQPWGGIALQLDNTCRIGDDRMEGDTASVGIRWRYGDRDQHGRDH
jgi:hypothetical protein